MTSSMSYSSHDIMGFQKNVASCAKQKALRHSIKHIGIILDGNRRLARDLMKKPWEGHKLGLLKGREAIEWACTTGIKHITAYALSFENLKSRPKRELAYILKYIGMEADSIVCDRNHPANRYNVRVRFIGRINILPPWLRKKIALAEKATMNHSSYFLNIAIAYGGQQEIVDAIKEIIAKSMKGIISVEELDEKIVKNHLYTNGQPYPDLIIRTGGEKRLSNFLSFQSAYSELIFLDKRWPEITKEDFIECINEFNRRQRRFGA